MKVIVHPEYRNLTSFVQYLPVTFDCNGELLYRGRNTVKRYEVGGVCVVVKKYKHPNLIQRIAYTFFKKSKTERAYKFAALLREKQIDTPHEVAYIEIKKQGLFTTGFFISENCSDPDTSVLLKEGDFDHCLANALAGFLVELHEKGILHGDLNLTNILYHSDEDQHYHFSLIDTNRSVFKKPTHHECLDNLKRITHNRELLIYIITLYAKRRGWNPEECVEQVIHQLGRFEESRRIKRKFQDFFGIRHA